MRGAIPPFPNTPSWRGAQLKHRDNFTFHYPLGGCAPLFKNQETMLSMYKTFITSSVLSFFAAVQSSRTVQRHVLLTGTQRSSSCLGTIFTIGDECRWFSFGIPLRLLPWGKHNIPSFRRFFLIDLLAYFYYLLLFLWLRKVTAWSQSKFTYLTTDVHVCMYTFCDRFEESILKYLN